MQWKILNWIYAFRGIFVALNLNNRNAVITDSAKRKLYKKLMTRRLRKIDAKHHCNHFTTFSKFMKSWIVSYLSQLNIILYPARASFGALLSPVCRFNDICSQLNNAPDNLIARRVFNVYVDNSQQNFATIPYSEIYSHTINEKLHSNDRLIECLTITNKFDSTHSLLTSAGVIFPTKNFLSHNIFLHTSHWHLIKRSIKSRQRRFEIFINRWLFEANRSLSICFIPITVLID